MNETTTNALLPCPCCGKPAILDTEGHVNSRVRCSSCHLRTGWHINAIPSDIEQMYADWNRRTPIPTKSNHDLHREIMNIPCNYPKSFDLYGDGTAIMHYKSGHRDARHAAAELALQLTPAPVNTQGGGLRDKMERVVSGYSGDPHPIVREVIGHIIAALAQAEQEQAAPALGLSILEAAQAIQNQAKGQAVGVELRVTLPAGTSNETLKYGANYRVIAYADIPGELPVTAGAYTLPGIVGEMTNLLNKQ